MNQDEIPLLLDYLRATWPRFEISKERILIFAEHFELYTVEEMKRAVLHFAKNARHPYPPSIPELHETLRATGAASSIERGRYKLLPEPDHDREAVIESQRDKLDALYDEKKVH